VQTSILTFTPQERRRRRLYMPSSYTQPNRNNPKTKLLTSILPWLVYYSTVVRNRDIIYSIKMKFSSLTLLSNNSNINNNNNNNKCECFYRQTIIISIIKNFFHYLLKPVPTTTTLTLTLTLTLAITLTLTITL
jgi:hypothetical protein